MYDDLKNQLEELIAPKMNEWNLEIVDFKITRRTRTVFIEVAADRPAGRINVDECAKINRYLLDLMEEKALLAEDYIINVSSPGLDRPLKTKKDFLRVVGNPVRFHLAKLVEKKLEHNGVVKSVGDHEVTIATKSTVMVIPFAIINKAVQIL